MGKKCPNCGFKYQDELDNCPKCGFDLKNQSTTGVPDDKNDDIKWSEYGDVPLESVMEMFDETPETEKAESKETVTESVAEATEVTKNELETNEEVEEPIEDKKATEDVEGSEEVETVEETIDAEQSTKSVEELTQSEDKSTSVELEPSDEEDTESSLLAAYIREHRGDNVEETLSESEKSIAQSTEPFEEPEENVSEEAEKEEPAAQEIQVEQITQEETNVQEAPESVSVSSENGTAVELATPTQEEASKETVEEPVEQPTIEPVSDEVKNEEETADVTPTPIFGEAPKEADTNKVLLDKVEILDSDTEEEASVGSTQTESNGSSNKKRMITRGITAAAVLILGASAWTVYSQNKKANEAQQVEETKKKATELESIQKSLNEFYTDDSHEFIRVEKVSTDLTKLSTQLEALKDQKDYKKVSTEFKKVSDKVETIQKVNALFTAAVISDNTLVKDPVLKEDKKLELEPLKEDSAFAKLMNQAIAAAQTQFDDLQTAKELVDVIYVDGKVTDKANKENYDAAKKAVEKVKNKELIKELTKGLEAVKKQIDTQENKAKEEAEKAEAQRQAEAAKQAEEAANADVQAKANATNNATNTANSSQNTASGNDSSVPNVEWTYDSKGMRHPVFQKNNQGLPILSSRQSDINDVNNPAWTWSPGIQENVLSIAFNRGYIVEGGYYLEPVRIEDGEGFYNLYATAPSKLLGAENTFPVYLMTINCKTGWFGGNGSDQTQ
ncbi:hypothetical protein IGI37_001891 [Enterococcus sp. AZ194]|uniref:cell division site-positioning protein MapZ family protein n=1 Tax=Enterococcus sp. AZ194 TaxID=2774629 RepID=UPI003F2309EC